MGRGVLSKTVIGCGLPSSLISNCVARETRHELAVPVRDGDEHPNDITDRTEYRLLPLENPDGADDHKSGQQSASYGHKADSVQPSCRCFFAT